MPNWCSNTAKFSHTNKEKIEQVIAAAKKRELLEFFIPMPQELHITSPATKEEQDQANKNIEAHGYPDWYHWRIAKWGTKWDIYDAHIRKIKTKIIDNTTLYSVKISFETAWSPPIEVYEEATNQGFDIRATYQEEGVGFMGIFDQHGDREYKIVPQNDLKTIQKDHAVVHEGLF